MFIEDFEISQAWWLTFVIGALGRQRQEDCYWIYITEFQASQGYVGMRACESTYVHAYTHTLMHAHTPQNKKQVNYKIQIPWRK